jgi:hypothetical protein
MRSAASGGVSEALTIEDRPDLTDLPRLDHGKHETVAIRLVRFCG